MRRLDGGQPAQFMPAAATNCRLIPAPLRLRSPPHRQRTQPHRDDRRGGLGTRPGPPGTGWKGVRWFFPARVTTALVSCSSETVKAPGASKLQTSPLAPGSGRGASRPMRADQADPGLLQTFPSVTSSRSPHWKASSEAGCADPPESTNAGNARPFYGYDSSGRVTGRIHRHRVSSESAPSAAGPRPDAVSNLSAAQRDTRDLKRREPVEYPSRPCSGVAGTEIGFRSSTG